jgi:hypothetical protein
VPRRALSLAVVGADHPNKRGPTRRFEIRLCKPGEPIELRPEPKNRADPRAVAVYSERGVQIGYLTAERAPMVGSWIAKKRKLTAVFQERATFGAVIRVGLDGEMPTLPAPRPEHRYQDEDFWPDPVWDDD